MTDDNLYTPEESKAVILSAKRNSFSSINWTKSVVLPMILVAIALIILISLLHFFEDKALWPLALITLGLSFSGLTAYALIQKTKIGTQSHGSQNTSRKNLEMAIAEGLQEAIFIIDRKATITYANQAAKRLFPDLSPMRPLTNFVRDPAVAQIVSDTLEGKIAAPKSIIRPGSVDRHLRISGAPIISERGGDAIIKRAVIIFADVTEIERTNTQRADFLANASHELKTPIASVLGYIETLRGHAKDDPEAQAMFLGIMQEQAERMQRLITDILSLRKIELSEHLVPTERADLGLAAKAALEAAYPIAQMRQVRLSLSGKKKNALVMGSQDELVQLTLNLVDNAVRMSPKNSKVTLELDKFKNWVPGQEFRGEPMIENAPRRKIVTPPRAGVDYWRLTIRDSGPGFTREHLPRLGERFYRVVGDRSSKEKGTGLGLAIVKHIVRWHRGGLYIESAEGVGTEFTIILPIAPSQDHEDDHIDIASMERGAR